MYFEQNISGPIFIADAPDVVIGSANSGNVRATITVNGDSWDIELSPSLQDGEYKARLRLKDVLDSIVGSPDFLDATASTIAPKVSIKADNGMEEAVSMEFQALYGNAEGKTPADMKRHWLTWREQISATTRSAREFLTFVSGLKLLGWKAGTFSAMARLFIHGSEPIDIPISEGQLESDCKYYKICYSPSKLCEAASVDISKLMAIDCWFSLSGTDSGGSSASVTSFPLRMIVSGANDLRMKEFIFRNSLGIEDRVISFGVNTRNVDGESRVFTSDGLSHELDNSSIESFQVQSGNISSARGAALWSDFLKASGRYMVSGEKATEIVVEEWDTDITEGALGSVSFKYHLSRTDFGRWFEDSESLGNYDPLEKFGALSVAGPEVATPPAEDLFFLKTRLDEFPLVELGEDFLFLVQSGASYSWGSASLKSLRDWLVKNVSTEALQLWCGPWEDYSDAVSKFALSAGAGKDLRDQLESSLHTSINGIKALIPSAASFANQLADKEFVCSLIATNTATFRGTFDDLATLTATSADINDYAFYVHTDEIGNTAYDRYKHDGTSWVFEYTLNNSSFTAAQWSAINSGITTTKVAKYDNHLIDTRNPHNVTKSQVGLGNVENVALSSWTGSTKISTLGTITKGVWNGTKIANTYLEHSSITIGTTLISLGSTVTELAGITKLQLNDANSNLAYDSTTGAWKLTGNLLVTGFITAGTPGTGTGGGSSYTQREWSEIKIMTASEIGLLASAYSVKEAYEELNAVIDALASKATNVKFTQTIASGKQIGALAIDGAKTILYAPASYAWGEITGKPTTLSGYGITDAKIANGVITLGANTITPLTSHQSVVLASGTNNGTLKLTVGTITTDNIAVKGLGSAAYTNSTAYAAASHTHSQYLTAHQTIYKLTIQKNGVEVGTFTANSENKTINIADVASASGLAEHKKDTTSHLSSEEHTHLTKLLNALDVDAGGDVFVVGGKGFYTSGFITAGQKGTSGGEGSSYTQKEWADIKLMTAAPTETGILASAYSVKEAYDDVKSSVTANSRNITSLAGRVTTLEGKATAVSFSRNITSGVKIGSISIDSTTTDIYSPSLAALMGTTAIGGESAYPYWNGSAWATKSLGTAAFQPTSAFAAASHTHSYLPLSGGTMTGTIVMGTDKSIIGINELGGGMVFFSSTSKKTVLGSVGASTTSATHIRSVTGHATIGTTETAINDILDSGNYSSYASPKTHTHTLKINGVTKTIAATGGTAVDLGSYLPVTGGTMSNTNLVVNLNANYLGGITTKGFLRKADISTLTNKDLNYANNIYGAFNYGDDNTQLNTPTTTYGVYISFGTLATSDSSTTRNQTGQIVVDCWNDLGRTYVRARKAGDRDVSQFGSWRTLAFTTDNVASSSKWANPRTITLTGSVTGSVSIDGSQNVSLATTTNHTHLYAGSATAGGAANTLLGDYVGAKGPNYFGKNKVGALMMNTAVNSNSTWKDWLILDCYSNDNAGGAVAFGISRQTLGAFIMRSNADRESWAESAELLGTHNYNTYCPTLTGTGASGTWGISISGNAATATNADTLDGVHFQNILEREQSGGGRGTAAGWYRIAETYQNNSDSYSFLLGIQRSYGYANNETYLFSICISYNGRISITQISGYANVRLIDKIRVDWSRNAYYIDLYIASATEGNTYRWYTVGAAKSYTAWTANPTLNGTAYEFTTVNGCKSDLGFTGNIAGNATSATQLQTSRTIWGQSFNGTGNVSGALSGVTDINKVLYINSSGNVGIGTTSPSYKLHVVGAVYSTAGLITDGAISAAKTSTSSDIRLKENISEIGSKTALNWLLMLKPKSWTWNDKAGVTGQSMGFVAQDVEGILPQMVKKQDNGYLSLDYTQLHALEVSAIQSHENEIERLKDRVSELESEINRLKQYAN